MAILMDLNQVMIANLMAQIGNHQNAEVDENMLRHMILNTIRFNRKKFKDEFGELIICADAHGYWRKNAFPYYKANRKKDRDKSELDWNAIFASLNKIREELKEVFPYKVIRVDHAEADDSIGTIIRHVGQDMAIGEQYLILSGDKDYRQLHGFANVKQYDPVQKKWVEEKDPAGYLHEHIIRGDKGDGIPNVLSPDNCLVMDIRQKSITAKKLDELKDINKMTGEVARNYARNKTLIDLSQVPATIQAQIIQEFEAPNPKDRSQLLNFFIKNKLKLLTEYLGDF